MKVIPKSLSMKLLEKQERFQKRFNRMSGLEQYQEEMKQLSGMTTRELVAYWNILQFSRRMGARGESKTIRHIGFVSKLLKERNVPHKKDRLTVAAKDPFIAFAKRVQKRRGAMEMLMGS